MMVLSKRNKISVILRGECIPCVQVKLVSLAYLISQEKLKFQVPLLKRRRRDLCKIVVREALHVIMLIPIYPASQFKTIHRDYLLKDLHIRQIYDIRIRHVRNGNCIQ